MASNQTKASDNQEIVIGERNPLLRELKELVGERLEFWQVNRIIALSDYFITSYTELSKSISSQFESLFQNHHTARKSNVETQLQSLYNSYLSQFKRLKDAEPTSDEIQTLASLPLESREYMIGFALTFVGDKMFVLFSKEIVTSPAFITGLVHGAIRKIPSQLSNSQSIINHIQDQASKIDQIVVNALKESESLTKFYEEKLRFDSPAKYWNELKSAYKRQAWIWFVISISILTCACIGGYHVLTNFDKIFTKPDDTLSVIKASVMLSVIVSLVYYAVHQTFKLCLSAFHLQRDSAEREQLTHLYLSLKNEKAVEEADRIIILQSLFSRADTGLIKGDSQPTMPFSLSNIIPKSGTGNPN